MDDITIKVAVMDQKLSNVNENMSHMSGTIDLIFEKLDRMSLDFAQQSRDITSLVEKERHISVDLDKLEIEHKKLVEEFQAAQKSLKNQFVISIGSFLGAISAIVWSFFTK